MGKTGYDACLQGITKAWLYYDYKLTEIIHLESVLTIDK